MQPVEEARFHKLADLFAYMEQDGMRDSQGRDVLAIYLECLPLRTRFRMRAQIKAARVRHAKVVFAALFPADHLPPVVEIAA